jgi:hypothetical protein
MGLFVAYPFMMRIPSLELPLEFPSPYTNDTGTGLLANMTVYNAHTGSWVDELEGR